MSQRELKEYKVISCYIEKQITRERAAELLGLSPRQITRLKKGVQASGAESLIHKNTGRKPRHALPEETKKAILQIHEQQEYAKVNFMHFKELLEERHGIHISYTALRKLLVSEGIASPKKRRVSKKRKLRRARKEHEGELLQIDATPYEWFQDDKKYALHGAIDDATGKIVGLYMTQNECLFGYFEVMYQCCTHFGIPQTVYSDKHSIFRSPKKDSLSVEEIINGESIHLTQFGRALYELGANITNAHSPQAKGRVERLWETLQSRLPVEFASRQITNVEDANKFLQEYIDIFNKRFSIQAEAESLFVPLRPDINLREILCIKIKRKTDKAGVFSFRRKAFQILDKGFPVISAKKEITVLLSSYFGIRVQYDSKTYDSVEFRKPDPPPAPANPKPKKSKAVQEEVVLPHLKHGTDAWKKIWHYEDYNESLAFLTSLFLGPQNAELFRGA